jgi:DinB superfamily
MEQGRIVVNRLETLERVQRSRAEWDALVSSVPDDRWQIEAWPDGWNLRDIIAHVDFYEWWAGELVRKRDWPVVDPSLNTMDTDARNNALYALNKERSFDEVRSDSERCHYSLIDALEGLTDTEFDNPTLLGMEGPGWTVEEIAGNQIWGHYEMHKPHVEAILAACS